MGPEDELLCEKNPSNPACQQKQCRLMNSCLSSISIGFSAVVTTVTIISCLAFSYFLQKGLGGFSKQVNAFVGVGEFTSILLQSLLAVFSIVFILYLFLIHLSSARCCSKHISLCTHPCILFIVSCGSHAFLITWVLLLCFVSSVTLVYFIFIGSMFSFCALLDQQCFDFKVLIPAIVSKISNRKIDMVMCAEKQELLCAQKNNQIWAFGAAFFLCLLTFAGALIIQNFVVYDLGKYQKRTSKKAKDPYELVEMTTVKKEIS